MDGCYVLIHYICDGCGCDIPENRPHYKEDTTLCCDCAYIKELITEREYLDSCGICIDNAGATVVDGKVIAYMGKKPPWEADYNDYRHTKKYKNWRVKVFIRDDYTCQKCQQIGGQLEAHHIKSFKNYKKLRYRLSNGVTYCLKCHRNHHSVLRQKAKEGANGSTC